MRIGSFLNFTNPWQTISAGERGVARTQNAAWNGILTDDPHYNPYTNRDWMSRYIFLIRDRRERESPTVATTRANTEANGRLNNSALPAEITRA